MNEKTTKKRGQKIKTKKRQEKTKEFRNKKNNQ